MVSARPKVDWEELLGKRLPGVAARLTAARLVLLAGREPSKDPINSHPHPELCAVLRGAVDVLTSSATLRLRPGSVLLVAPHMYHRSLAVGREAETVWLRAPPNHMGGSLARVRPDGQIAALGSLDLLDFEQGHRLLMELIDELSSARRGRLELCRGLLAALFVRALRRVGAGGRFLPPDDEWPAAQIVTYNARHYIEKNYMHPLSLAEVAHHVALSPNYLAALFKRQFGRTIIDCLTEVRIAEAKRLLQETGRTVGEIAETVGYQSPYYFSRAFKKAVGRPPSDFRRPGAP
jgi:AraC-like DNA-binding protein